MKPWFFIHLDKEQIKTIAEIQINRLRARLAEREYGISITDEAWIICQRQGMIQYMGQDH